MPDDTPLILGGTPNVYVSDLDRAVAFYTQTLGLKLFMRAGNEYASVDAGRGFHVACTRPDPTAPSPVPPAPRR